MSIRRFLVVAALLAGCSAERVGPVDVPVPAPSIDAALAQHNADNALSALVDVMARDADSVAVTFHLDGDAGPADSVTPAVSASSGSVRVPVLGLRPASLYQFRVRAWGRGGVTLGPYSAFTTDTLPPDLPVYTAGGSDPSPGYVAFASGRYGIVIDNAGRVVWYHRFPNGPGLSFQAEPSGTWVTRPGTPAPGDIEPWIEVDPLGHPGRAFACADGLQPRPHDLLVLADSSFWILCDDVRTMDLSWLGASATARVMGTAVQHLGADGRVLFRWTPFDHFSLGDVDSATLATPVVNWTHGNALDLDSDGNVIVSFRNLSEVVKVDVATGAVLWRLGGRHNAFVVSGAVAPLPFTGQHGARSLGGGELLVLDNLGDPAASRAERYHVDPSSMTAQLERSFGSLPGVVTTIGGSVQGLPDGHTLVSFGTAGRVEEYDAAGVVVWRIGGNPGYIFRAQRIASLYRPGVTWPR